MRKKVLFILLITAVLSAVSLCSVSYAEGKNAVSGTVWNDKNANGIMDRDESPCSGVTVILQQLDGQYELNVAQVKTGKDGSYSFTNLADGKYRIEVTSNDLNTSVYGKDNVLLPSSGKTGHSAYQQLSGKVVWNAGLLKNKNFIGTIAYIDGNENGGRGNNEEIVKDIEIALVCEIDGEEWVVGTFLTTKSDKSYGTLRNITPGTYRLRATLPEGYVPSVLGSRITLFNNTFSEMKGDYAYSLPFELETSGSVGHALGLVPAATVTGYVKDDTGTGLESIRLEMKGIDDDSLLLAQTDESGRYTFKRVRSGSYMLYAKLPDGLMFSENASLITADNTNYAAAKINVVKGKTNTLQEIKAVKEKKLIFTVVKAQELVILNDGMLQKGQNAAFAQGVKVALYTSAGEVLDEKCVSDGVVEFSPLRGNGLNAVFTLGENEIAYVIGAGSEKVYNSGEALPVFPDDSAEYQLYVTEWAEITGCVFEDKNDNGVMDAGESPLKNMLVEAQDATGFCRRSVKTDDQGAYTLTKLFPSEYTVCVSLDSQYIAAQQGSDNALVAQTPVMAMTEAYTLSAATKQSGVCLGLYKAGVVTGTVKMDDGITGADLGGMEGVRVELTDTAGNLVSEYSYADTVKSGEFVLKGIKPGEYVIRYQLPDNCIFISPEEGTTEYRTGKIIVSASDNIVLDPVAAVACAEFSGTVLHKGMPVDAGVELRGSALNNLYSTRTEADGSFCLKGIRPDTYTVSVQLSEGYIFGEGTDSFIGRVNANSASFEKQFAVGEKVSAFTVDAAQTGSICGYVFNDHALNGNAQDVFNEARSGITVSLIWNNRILKTEVSDADGAFGFTNIIPGNGYKIKVELQQDMRLTTADDTLIDIPVTDGDNMIAVNIGIMKYASVTGNVRNLDSTFDHVGNLQVSLYDESTGDQIARCITDAEGSYRFEKLMPGRYYFDSTLPEGFNYARQTDEKGGFSSFILVGGEKVPFQVTMGNDMQNMDICIGAPGRIGDYCWLDSNRNGLIDIGEAQIPGIQIEISQYGEVIAQTVSDAFGWWEFADLYPGEYTVRVTMPDEVKTTRYRDDFPVINSILPQDVSGVATVVINVPSAARNLNCDMGFALKKDNVYPESMKDLPQIDWSFGGKKTYPTY